MKAIITILSVFVLSACPLSTPKINESVIEIRNYHYNPEKYDLYKEWAVNEAIPFLKANLDVLGFWMGNVEPAEISGSAPMTLDLNSANITWVIRWDSMEERSRIQKEVFGTPSWQEIWSKHPDPEGYQQMEIRFSNEY